MGDPGGSHPPAHTPPAETASSGPLTRRLGTWDAISIIVGIVVGVSIFKAPALVFSNVTSPWTGLSVWALGGLLSLVGALCYAELATTYPRIGGDYVYLSRAYGSWAGFLFGWAQLVAILTGSIGAMAYVFADYAVGLAGASLESAVWWAAGATLLLTALNLLGVVFGKTTQNLLTIAKVVGLGGVLAAALFTGGGHEFTGGHSIQGPGFGLAMILVLYAYGGWNDASFVAAEVRDPQRNIPRALLGGVGIILLLYLLINGAYLWSLGFDGVRASGTPAADVLHAALGEWGSRGMSLLVMVSALGAINGLIFTGSRIFAGMGADYRLFAVLGRWHPRIGSPVMSLVAQCAVALLLIVAVGTPTGRDTIDRAMQLCRLRALPWERYGGGFDTLVAATAPVFWLFFLMTGVSLFLLRWLDRQTPRVFRVPLYPLEPLVFCGMCGWMLYSSILYARELALVGLVPLALGGPLYCIAGRRSAAA